MPRVKVKAAKRGGRRPGRPAGATGDRTRERVLGAAAETFARRGLAGTSVRDIAKQARIRVSTLYHYFPSKEALYEEVQQRVHAQVREIVVQALGESGDLRTTTRKALGDLFDLFLENRAYVQLGCRTILESPPRAASDARIADRWLGLTEGQLKPAELRGQVKNIDPVLFMVTVDALVHWHIVNDGVYRRLLGKGLDDPAVAARVREHVIQVALRTLGLD
jgi:AcrR family transcriptional regulator